MLRFVIIAVCIALSVADYDKKVGYGGYGYGLNNIYPYGLGGSLANLFNYYPNQLGYNYYPGQVGYGYGPYSNGYYPYGNGYGYGLNNYFGSFNPYYSLNGGYNYPGVYRNNYLYNGYGSYPYGLNSLNNNFLGFPGVGLPLTSVPAVLPGVRRRSVY